MLVPGLHYVFVHLDSVAGRLPDPASHGLDDPRVIELCPKAYASVARQDDRNFLGTLVDWEGTTIVALCLTTGELRHLDSSEYRVVDCVEARITRRQASNDAMMYRTIAFALWKELDEAGRAAFTKVLPGYARVVREVEGLDELAWAS